VSLRRILLLYLFGQRLLLIASGKFEVQIKIFRHPQCHHTGKLVMLSGFTGIIQ